MQMLGYLPIIFFGAATPGPMRTVAITLWVVLFPGYEGQMTAFGFVQHNFFIFFNAAIGLVFLNRANRELFGQSEQQSGSEA
jgi:threonine/homoserine/homoserine lactone efflux protein